MKEKSLQFFVYFWKTHKTQMSFTWLEIIKKNIFGYLCGAKKIWLDNVIFAWIKVANVQSQFTPTPLEVLTNSKTES